MALDFASSIHPVTWALTGPLSSRLQPNCPPITLRLKLTYPPISDSNAPDLSPLPAPTGSYDPTVPEFERRLRPELQPKSSLLQLRTHARSNCFPNLLQLHPIPTPLFRSCAPISSRLQPNYSPVPTLTRPNGRPNVPRLPPIAADSGRNLIVPEWSAGYA